MSNMSGLGLQVLERLADASVRAILLAVIAWPASRMFRSAAARHAIWSILLAAMLALPLLSPLLPSLHPEVVGRYTPPLSRFELKATLAASPAPVGAISNTGRPPRNPRGGPSSLQTFMLWPLSFCSPVFSWKISPHFNPCSGPFRSFA